jgi:hypothetical protein
MTPIPKLVEDRRKKSDPLVSPSEDADLKQVA